MEFGLFLNKYFELIGALLKLLFKEFKIGIDFETEGVDERIKKIEIAKQNLIDGLTAIEELKKEAEANKKEIESAMYQIDVLKKNKDALENETQQIKQIIASDVSTFKKIAGVPTEKQVKRERIIGFVSGVIASLIASGIISLIILIYNNWSVIINFFDK